MDTDFRKSIKGPAVAVDTVVFGIDSGMLVVLLLKIGSGPYKNKWSLPGGLVRLAETPDDAATRVLKDKTNIQKGHIEQLYTFGDLDRDVRGQIISVAYLLLVGDVKKFKVRTTDFYTDISWVSIKNLPAMAFDHTKIIEVAHSRLKSKIVYSNIAYSLLPPKFTLSELQKVYEIILGESVDKRNFRKKIAAFGMVEPVDEKRMGAFRPAELYKFKKNELVYFS